MLIYSQVNCAFSLIFDLSCIHLNKFKTALGTKAGFACERCGSKNYP